MAYPVGEYIWMEVLLLMIGMQLQLLGKSQQVLNPQVGGLVPIDMEATFRLPNQSAHCLQFVNNFYLDRLPLRSLPFKGSPMSNWPKFSKELETGSKNTKVKNPKDPVEFDRYFHRSTADPHQSVIYAFSSPSYPNNYPASLDCIKVIRAPSAKYRIVLNFRGPFRLEPSTDCTNDYLEVRDGQFGFSPLLNRYCSNNGQLKAIHSSGQWLWLRFHSDFSIERPGFQAVYYFTDIPQVHEEVTTATGKPLLVETVINTDTGDVIQSVNMSELLEARMRDLDPVQSKNGTFGENIEFIIDLRTESNQMPLLLHLSYMEFPRKDPTCQSNLIEVYDHFFLSDRERIKKGGKSRPEKYSSVMSKVHRACNKPDMDPTIHTLGRAVVRILHSSSYGEKLNPFEAKRMSNMTSHLPELILSYTALSKAPCKPGWVPCLTLEDLRSKQDRWRSSNLSMFDILMPNVSTSTSTKPLEKIRGLGLDSIYCVSRSLICNGFTNCPKAEDEDECPRTADWLEQLMVRQPSRDHISESEREATKAMKERGSKENDDFPHHTSIIVGLLGFCAFCGLLSAGVTLFDRSKHSKHSDIASWCEALFFPSRGSMLVNLEVGPTAEKRKNSIFKTKLSPRNEVQSAVEPQLLQLGQNNVVDLSDEIYFEDINVPSKCLCPSLRKGKTENKVERDKTSVEKDQEALQSVTSSELHEGIMTLGPSESEKFCELFEHATLPLECIKKLETSPSWNASRLSRFSPGNKCIATSHTTFEFRPYTGQSLEATKSAAASFGHLPNTVVIPVEKLSGVVYHCGKDRSTLSSMPPYWQRSGPLPIVGKDTERTGLDEMYRSFSHLFEVQSVHHSKRNSEANLAKAEPNARTTTSLLKQNLTYETNSYKDLPYNCKLFEQNEPAVKRQHSHVTAAKRPRYSTEPLDMTFMKPSEKRNNSSADPIGSSESAQSMSYSSGCSNNWEKLDSQRRGTFTGTSHTYVEAENNKYHLVTRHDVSSTTDTETTSQEDVIATRQPEVRSHESISRSSSTFRVTVKPTYYVDSRIGSSIDHGEDPPVFVCNCGLLKQSDQHTIPTSISNTAIPKRMRGANWEQPNCGNGDDAYVNQNNWNQTSEADNTSDEHAEEIGKKHGKFGPSAITSTLRNQCIYEEHV